MNTLYVAIRDAITGPMPPECIMAARDAIEADGPLDLYLALRGLTNHNHYDYPELNKATQNVRSKQ